MHNNIMAAGSKDRPPMLGPGRYSQWRSRFLRYLDTKSNGEYLRKCIFEGPYTPTSVLIAAVEAAENIPPVAAHEEAETIHNMTTENKLYFQAEKEAIFLILTGIGDEIYSTVDACNTAKEMWTAIERLQQGESLNVQDVKTNLFWEFGKFTSRDGESMESYYSRFYKLMNELTRNNLQVSPMQVNVQFLQQLQPEWSRFVTVVKQREEIDTVSYHRLFDVLKQFQNEVNDIRSERLARSANPLALLAAAQPYSDNYYQAPKPQRSNAPSYMQSSSTRPSASTRHKGKEIAKPVTPQSESVSEEDSDPEQARRDKDMQKNLALLAKYFKKLYKPTNNNLRTSSNSRNKTEDTTPRYNNDNQSGQFGNQRTMTVAGARETVGSPVVQQNGIQCFNCKGFGHYARECRKPKRVKDYAYHKEKMMMCKQAEQGVPLQAEQADWLEDTDEEIDEQELEAHYSYMAKIQEVSPEESSSTSQPLEQVQNHDENDVFANVRRHSEQPESINDTYVLEKDDSNVIPDSSNICTNDNQVDQNAAECVDERAALANLIANLTLDTEENKTGSREATRIGTSCMIALQTKQNELEKYTALNDLTRTQSAYGPKDNGCLRLGKLMNQQDRMHKALDGQVKLCGIFVEKISGYCSFWKMISLRQFFVMENLIQGNVMNQIGLLRRREYRFNNWQKSSFRQADHSSKGRLNIVFSYMGLVWSNASCKHKWGRSYILVIVDDYSRYTWTLFLRSKDETPEVLKDFLTMIQRNLQAQVISVRTDRGTEFLEQDISCFISKRLH
ncbi:retrovirus-related pol polyprotein from transposon TNT 1-94 [Tanacetum coccineum]